MSSKIKVDTIENVAGSGNVSLGSGHNLVVPGDLAVDTNVLKVDSSNNRVGIGTASPSSDLHVSGGAGAHVAIQSSAGSHWRLGDAVGSSNGIFVIRDHTNSANRVQILANGKTQIAQGITFGSDTADANTLDDYEEGTYDVTMTCGTSGTITMRSDYNTGGYIKVGSIVHVHGYVVVSAISSPNGYIEFNLPFPVLSTSEGHASTTIYTHIGSLSGKNTNEIGNGLAFNNSSVFRVYSTDGTGYGTSSANALTSSSFVYFGGSYRTTG